MNFKWDQHHHIGQSLCTCNTALYAEQNKGEDKCFSLVSLEGKHFVLDKALSV